MSANTIDVDRVVDGSRTNRFQITLLVLCGLCMIIDGFDVQAMGYVAPAIINNWHVAKAELGPVFGASLFGMLIGSLTLTVLADKIGRRPVLIIATFFFAACMALTTQVHTIDGLLWMRFITGIALGCLMPNAMALAGEFSPSASRVTRMMLVSCGFTVGAAVGGFISAALIPRFGWESVFWVGAILPAVLALAMLPWLPESIQYLVLHNRPARHAVKWLRRLDPGLDIDDNTRLHVHEAAAGGVPVSHLFREGRTGVTLLLWGVNFLNLINLYFLSNWLPTLLHSSGYSTSTAVLIGTSLQVGGVVGTLTLGSLIERLGFIRVLTACFAIACVTIALIGITATTLPWLLISVILTGFCIIGGQPAVNALAGTYYPTSLRSTGIGWSLGIGRVGSVIGPVIGGQLIAMQWSNGDLFFAAAVPALVSAILIAALVLTSGAAVLSRPASSAA
jgi:AAHS family 4-hydroxybenzoate transporter-like MFS transporter